MSSVLTDDRWPGEDERNPCLRSRYVRDLADCTDEGSLGENPERSLNRTLNRQVVEMQELIQKKGGEQAD